MKKFAIGADIGGSHISCAVIDLEKEVILKETLAFETVDNKASSDDILKQWSQALNASLSRIDKEQLAGLGFAMPGPFDYSNGIALFTSEVAKYENLYNVDVAKRLNEMSGPGTEIRFINDASAFGVGEAWMGKAKGSHRSVSITLGTGFGSAFIEGGIPVVERAEVPGSGYFWHVPYKDGVADDYFSTRWYVNRYAEKSGRTVSGVKEIAEATGSDSAAKEVFLEFGQNLGEFLAPWLKGFGAEALVIGGNIAGAYNLFGEHLEQSLVNQNINTKISLSELKEDAALIGSARLFDASFWKNVQPLLEKM